MSFDFQPRLEGALAILRPTVRADVEPLCCVASDPELWAQHPVPELARPDVFATNLEDAFGDRGGLTVIDRASGAIVGFSRYSQRFSGENAAEVGWTVLARRLWGGAFNRDVKRLMLGHALAAFPTVTFRVGANNLRSRRALEKIGAAPNGWWQDVESHGRVGRRVGYSITREAFLSGPLMLEGGS